MSHAKVYLSYDYVHDGEEKALFAAKGHDCLTPFSVQGSSEKPSGPDDAGWLQEVREKIEKSHMLIVLVGQHMDNVPWVEKEVAIGHELDLPVFGVYVGGAGPGAALPEGLDRKVTIRLEWDDVANVIYNFLPGGRNR
ncbi:MAG: TIR domain-containing protein [Thermodesulfobacteriota bacterium]